MLDDDTDLTRNQEHSSIKYRYAKWADPARRAYPAHPAGKPGNSSSAAKAVPLRVRTVAAASSSIGSPPRRPRLELSLTHILGSTGAAVTAAFLGSRLGVAGTLIGAGLASVISVVGGAVYTNSIKVTKQQVAKVIVAVRRPEEDQAAPVTVPLLPVGVGSPPDARPLSKATGRNRSRARTAGTRSGRLGLRGVLVAASLSAVVFVAALTLVTGYEGVSGTPLSGGQARGLTILGGRSVESRRDEKGTSGSGSTSDSTSDAPTTTTGSLVTRSSGTIGAAAGASGTGTSATSGTAVSTSSSATTPSTAATSPTSPPATSTPTGTTSPADLSSTTAAPTTWTSGDPSSPSAEPSTSASVSSSGPASDETQVVLTTRTVDTRSLR